MAEIGVGIVGYGLAGKVFHAPFVSAVPGLKLLAFVERSTDEAHAAYPVTHTYRTLEKLLNDPAIELVVVGTPNATHFSLAKQALEAGKHVVIDKPFTETSTQAEELIALAKAKGVVLAPFQNRRWDGDFLTVKKLLAERTLGRLVTFESHFDRFKPAPRVHAWKESANPANGMLMDLGPHLVDQALALFGLPQLVTASVRSDRDTTAIDDVFDIALTYPRLTVWLRATMLAAQPGPRFQLHGTHGSYRKYGLDPQEPAIVGGAKVPVLGSTADWLSEDESHWGELATAPDLAKPETLVRTNLPTERGDYREFYSNVRDAINGDASLIVTPQDGLATAVVLEAARKSSAESRSVTM
jgi:predicted dehydrogenase